MRAFVITAPQCGEVQEVAPPTAAPGQAVVDVERAGVCGTDAEFFTGEMAYLHTGQAAYPIRIGHEWVGTVSSVGDGVDASWVGQRVTGDTMLGCGHCQRCTSGRQHLCEDRYEIGIRNGWPGALAEQLPVPVTALHRVPDPVDAAAGALIEPGANALRSVDAAALAPGERMLVLGTGTIGLLVAMIAAARGIEVHLLARRPEAVAFARAVGFDHAWTREDLPALAFDAVVDASNAPHLPALAAELVEPGRRVVYVGLAGQPSMLDTRTLAFKDVTAVGILSGSPGLAGTIELYGSGAVDPRPLLATTVGLDGVSAVLRGERPAAWGPAPKVHVDPRR
ncbi:MAG TPA: alcohol dehydrogenase catalytic domain-containing protein [Egibacteraceae bacterium]|nr:alcohol dehydrogenase catalytic domain-containing protein [Egibacteraceae bacterium]